MTILRRLPLTFTQPSPQKLVPARHSAGLDGFTHRYMSEDIAPAVGTVATSWVDYVAGATLTGSNGPTVRLLADGHKYLEFDGVNDTLKNDAMASTVGTVILVAKSRSVDTGTTILASGTGVSINRSGTNGTVLNPGAGVTNATKLDNQWRFVAAVATASSASLTIDGVKAVATPGGVWGTSLRLGANGTPAFFSSLDCVEVITYPTALSDPQITTVRDALKQAYPALLL